MKRADIANFFSKAEIEAMLRSAPETVAYDPDCQPGPPAFQRASTSGGMRSAI